MTAVYLLSGMPREHLQMTADSGLRILSLMFLVAGAGVLVFLGLNVLDWLPEYEGPGPYVVPGLSSMSSG